MNSKEVVVDRVYHDGKQGVREVVALDASTGRLTYRILAAKVEQEYDRQKKEMAPVIGTTVECNITSFAQWAKIVVAPGKREEILADMAAKKLKLSPGETAFMDSVFAEFGADVSSVRSMRVSFESDELRAVRGLEKKGVLDASVGSHHGGDVSFTELGMSCLRLRQLGRA